MHRDLTGALRRGLTLAVVAASITLGVAACNDSTSANGTQDRTPPSVTLTPVTGTADTVISFRTDAKDNLGLKTIHVQAIGAVGFVFDTVFTSAVTNIDLPFTLYASRLVPPGTPVIITASATDSGGKTASASVTITVLYPPAPTLNVSVVTDKSSGL